MKQISVLLVSLVVLLSILIPWVTVNATAEEHVLSFPQAPYEDSFTIVINEIMPNPEGSDSQKEWLELWNYGDEEIETSQWYIESESSSGSIRTIMIPDIIIPANDYILLANDDMFDGNVDMLYIIDDPISLYNSNSSVRLYDNNQVVLDEITYSSTQSGISLERQGYLVENDICLELVNHSELHSAGLVNENLNTECTIIPDLPHFSIVFSTDQVNWFESIDLLLPQTLYFALIDEENFPVEQVVWSTDGREIENPYTFTSEFQDTIIAQVEIDNELVEFTSNDISITSETTVIITEVYPSPLEGENEWIEIYNYGQYPINLANWYFRDAGSNDDGFGSSQSGIVNQMLAPQSHLVLEDLSITLNNSGDTVGLFNSQNELIHAVSYNSIDKSASAILYSPYQIGLFNLVESDEVTKDALNPEEEILELVPIANTYDYADGEEVMISGVITSPVGTLGAQELYIQDQSGGIRLDLDTSITISNKVGDAIQVIGELQTSRGERELEVTSQDAVKPASIDYQIEPQVVSEVTSDLIGILVNIEGFIENNYSTSFDVKTNSTVIRVSMLSSTGIQLDKSKGDKVTVVGVASQYDDLVRVLPRFQSDVSVSKPLTVVSSSSTQSQSTNLTVLDSSDELEPIPYTQPRVAIEYAEVVPASQTVQTQLFLWPIWLVLSMVTTIVAYRDPSVRSLVKAMIQKHTQLRKSLVKYSPRVMVESMR